MKRFLYAVLLFLIPLTTNAQTAFLNTYPFNSGSLRKIIETFDNGYLLINGGGNIFLTKTNVWGSVLFQKSFTHGTFNLEVKDAIQTADSGFVILAHKSNNNSVIIKIDSIGNVLWCKEILGSASLVNADKVLQDSNGNLIVFVFSLQPGSPFVFNAGSIIKFNSLGVLLFSKSFRRTNAAGNVIFDVTGAITSDNGYILQGMDAWTWIKIDSLGNLQWSFKSPISYTHPVIDTSIFNQYYLLTQIAGKLYVEKMDSSGTLIWHKYFSYYHRVSEYILKSTSDGGFLVFASGINSVLSTLTYPFLLKCDSAGVIQSSATPFDTLQSCYFAQDLILTKDSGFICAFGLNSNIAVKKYPQLIFNTCNDFFLPIINSPASTGTSIVIIDSLSLSFQVISDSLIESSLSIPCNVICSNVGINSSEAHNFHLSLCPNPSNGEIKIMYLLPQNKSGTFQILDITGKQVFKSNLLQWSTLQNFNVQNLASGIYMCKITSDNFSVTKKLLVQQE